MKTQNTVAKRLAKLPHIISLPEPLPEPPELKRLIEARLVEVSSEQSHLDFRNEDQALEFAANKCVLAILEHHLTDLCAESPEVNQPLASPEPSKSSGPTKINFSQTTGSSGSDIPPQPHPTGSQVGPSGSDPLPTGSDPLVDSDANETPPKTSDDSTGDDYHQDSDDFCENNSRPADDDRCENDDDEDESDGDSDDDSDSDSSEDDEEDEPERPDDDPCFELLDDDLRDMSFELNEHLYHRSPFAKLTNNERQAILKLLEHNVAERVAELLAEPPPIGMNLKTSKSALNRFRKEHAKYNTADSADDPRNSDREALEAEEKAFQQVNQTDETFRDATERNIKKRLFRATKNINGDYHEIRWLIKSLEMLRKPNDT